MSAIRRNGKQNLIPNKDGRSTFLAKIRFTKGLWDIWLAEHNARMECNTGRVEAFRKEIEKQHPTKDD